MLKKRIFFSFHHGYEIQNIVKTKKIVDFLPYILHTFVWAFVAKIDFLMKSGFKGFSYYGSIDFTRLNIK